MTTNSNSEISMADLEEARTLILQVLSNDMYREVARTSRNELAALFAWVRLVPAIEEETTLTHALGIAYYLGYQAGMFNQD